MEKGELLAFCYDFYNQHLLHDQNDDILYYQNIAANLKPKKALVVGAGTGRVAIPLSHVANVEALDMDQYRLARLQNKRDIKCYCMDFCREVPNEVYDLIVIPYSTIQFATDIKMVEQFINNARSILSEDGMLIFDVSNNFESKKPTKNLLLFEDYAKEIASKITCSMTSAKLENSMSFETEFAIERFNTSVYENETYLYYNEAQFKECAKRHFKKIEIKNGYDNDNQPYKHLFHCRGK